MCCTLYNVCPDAANIKNEIKNEMSKEQSYIIVKSEKFTTEF